MWLARTILVCQKQLSSSPKTFFNLTKTIFLNLTKKILENNDFVSIQSTDLKFQSVNMNFFYLLKNNIIKRIYGIYANQRNKKI